ncbi:hypothetical protein AVEN_249296-1 [Araneus ventricosus]|uniref:Uncharacterized protein n=1 Tax=Araneus ventricosus TaxID=182803 RepID=A0A4Y2V4P4_ARAVE|nr:hypothetical protein AVEN_249296-1 [Araneus ventricosus]
MFCRTIKARRFLCHAFSLHVLRNAASRDWSNGKNNSPSSCGLQESHAFIGADVTGDENPKKGTLKAVCTRMCWNYRVPGIRIGEFVNSTSPLMSQYLTSKVIDRIANSECMP